MTTSAPTANRKLLSALLVGMLGCAASFALNAPPVAAADTGARLLSRLNEGIYEVPDFSCGYRHLQFTKGVARDHGEVITIEKAVIADLNGDGTKDAALHLSFSLGGRRMFNHLLVVVQEKNKLVQAADYSLEDYEDVKNVLVDNKGVISVDSMVAHGADGAVQPARHKVTKLRLMPDRESGCKLLASEWEVEPKTNRMLPFKDLAPYLFQVQDRISSHWNSEYKDAPGGDRVVVGFKIDDRGQVSDVRLDKSSEDATTDEAALQAVHASAPFPPLPQGVAHGLDVQFEFQYSVVCKSERSI